MDCTHIYCIGRIMDLLKIAVGLANDAKRSAPTHIIGRKTYFTSPCDPVAYTKE